ncbi:hypothetical protein SAY86_009272 [Trapa natans]|uniref:Uncharacterized protein n=1 Tax=Trapa natans TaxID=22666 RepID=A0AAN7L4K2_TRANT|nr:hypothetical protein SAY86_009272 [Trapa natans]
MGSRGTAPVVRSSSSEHLSRKSEDPSSQTGFPAETVGGEIDVFDARSHLDNNSCVQAEKGLEKREEDEDTPERKPGILSSIYLGSQHQKNNGGTRWKWILSGSFRCNRLCSDAKSVQVGKGSAQIKGSIGGESEFPALKMEELVEARPRKSLDVFGSGSKDVEGRDVVAMNLRRKLSMLTWDAIPEAENRTLSGNPYVPSRIDSATTRAEDMDSCASSDLFEIDSISAACRDGGGSRAAQSEAPPEKVQSETRRRPGLGGFSLSGCKSQKSVSVVTNPI